MVQISQERIDGLLTEFEKALQEALGEIAVAERLVCGDPASCQYYVGALTILAQAAVQSDTASLAAGLSNKALTDPSYCCRTGSP